MTKIQEILEAGWKEYKQENSIIPKKKEIIELIKACKTEKLGAHGYKCNHCGHEEYAYNSCRNRNCPSCQTGKRLKWLEDRKSEVLNIKYYHVVFTIPSELHKVALQNEVKMYKLMFKAASETLKELSSDKKYLGAEIGFFAVLHTWGQNLSYHPHIHMVVTGGGLNKLNKWVEKEKDFFIPAKVMAKKFKGKMLKGIKGTKLDFFGEEKYLKEQDTWNEFITNMYSKEWITYCKEPFHNAKCVIEYLGRYTHRVAISNARIKEVKNGTVKFEWKDYRDKNKKKIMEIPIKEFIRRFIIHILPYKFVKIRYYGVLGNRVKEKKLKKCKIQTRTKIEKNDKLTKIEILKKAFGNTFNMCKTCKKGYLELITATNST